jgi:signal transduction histidine kinase
VLGLRGRIVGALLVTTVATLGVAALALLGPLERQLRKADRETLYSELRTELHTKNGSFQALRQALGPGGAQLTPEQLKLTIRTAVIDLGSRIQAEVALLGLYPPIELVSSTLAARAPESFDDVATALRMNKTFVSFGSTENSDLARVAYLFQVGTGDDKRAYVLAVRRPITAVPAAVNVVRTAFITAALAGVALTLILGIPLAATLVRRLRRLRQAALQLAQGGPAVEIPVDRARDEVGDLTRTFATMQRRLEHQEQARRAFVATASHELRTPLTSLHGMLELLEEELQAGAPDIEDARMLLERARVQSRRLSRLAADLLDLSRLDAEVQLRSEPVELGELSRAVLAEFELGTAERGIRTMLSDEDGPVWALGDPGSVARILRILLDNAVRAAPDGSLIAVEIQRGEGPASISVGDAGPGVPPEDRDLIFARFQRGRATGGAAGFGLGLAIGRELAQRMGGELLLEEREGPGATFTMRLPAARAPDQDAVAVG